MSRLISQHHLEMVQSSAFQVNGGHARSTLWVCMCVCARAADGFLRVGKKWRCCHSKNRQVLRLSAPTRPSARSRVCSPRNMGDDLPQQGGEKVDSPPCEYRLPPRPLPGERKQRRAPGACRERSPGLQSIRRRCAQDELCIQGRSPRATRRAQTGAFCPGMVGGGRGRLAVSGRLPLARQQLRLGSSLFQLVPPEVFSSRQLVAGRGSASFRTVNYAAFVCRVGGWGQG